MSLAGKRVLLRVDFNVPTEVKDGATRITDDTRIQESLPTLNHLRNAGAKVIVMAHFGRPKGEVNLKDWILFYDNQMRCVSVGRDNTGNGEFNESMVFPTLKFPSDHAIVSTLLERR